MDLAMESALAGNVAGGLASMLLREAEKGEDEEMREQKEEKKEVRFEDAPSEEEEEYGGAEEEEEEEEDEGMILEEFGDATGDFTKRLAAMRNGLGGGGGVGPNSQARHAAHAHSALRTAEVDEERKKKRVKDRADRATVEQVLDPRTRLVLFRLLQRGTLESIDGCISTGKEANVYHARSGNNSIAAKIYKTSILTFKDRERYVEGEYRYRNGYCKSNPRKMVAVWAEKEFRNLLRMHEAGLRVPRPIMLKGHVLLMEFVGKDGWPAPLLKNAAISPEEAESGFVSTAWMMRKLFRDCKLIHGDLSEYNMLWMDGEVYIIDVSQSVEHDHPHSLEFLRVDIGNVIRFFRDAGSPVIGMRALFEFIVDPCVDDRKAEEILGRRSHDLVEDDALFSKVFIAHKLDHVLHFERDAEAIQEGRETNNPFETIMSKVEVVKGDEAFDDLKKEKMREDDSEGTAGDTETSDEDGSDEDSEEEGEAKEIDPKLAMYKRSKHETADERKERKKAVKDEQREGRQNKIPKHVKKRKAKMNKK
ncbi:hypothetical protein PFISCL1PPCAC_21099 [Pristionchus fissidentatus]|uniref:Serine/threonine-protein kinase RIO1 n=1 Tax=Pristionchus fissidentatus TaxID=1538716 RepID=A0AAV5WIU2_9BILA|nr:hypothetical protein PFISCL1PPCAC_21099 [Pristionchus fissidentatus]